MNHSLLFWAVLSGVTIISTGGLLLLLSQQRALTNQMARRLQAIVGDFATANGGPDQSRAHLKRSVPATMSRIERAFGYDRVRRSHRTTPFSRVLAVAVLLAAISGFVGFHMLGPIGYCVAAPCLLTSTRLYYRRCDAIYSASLFKQFPDALGMIVRAVRVGVGVGNAVVLVAAESQSPTCLEFRQLSDEIAIGRPLPEALSAMGVRNRLPEYRFFATALSLQSQTGGGLAETLETLADTIRKRVAIKARGHALASEARLSCYVLGGLPFVVGGLLFMTNSSYIAVLFTVPAGQKMLAAALGMLTAGMLVMQTMTKRALQ